MKKHICLTLAILAAATLAHGDVILLSTDFQNAVPGLYGNATIINNGRALHEQLNVSQTLPGSAVTFTSRVEVVEWPVSSGNQALAISGSLNPNSGGFNLLKTFPSEASLTTGDKGNNFIEAQIDFTCPAGPGTEIRFQIYGGGALVLDVRFVGDSRVWTASWTSVGGGGPNHQIYLTWGVRYRLYFTIDLSDPSQFLHGLKYVNLDTGALVSEEYDRKGTRGANPALPDCFYIPHDPRNSLTTSPSFVIHNVHIIARPKIRPYTLFMMK